MGHIYEKVEKVVENEDVSIKVEELLYYFCNLLEEVLDKEPELKTKFQEKIDKILLGPHFTEETLEEALNCLLRRDGSKGKYWSLDQTNDIAFQGKLKFTEEFNQYDFCYAMNYCRAKYEESIRNIVGDDSIKMYFELAKSWKPDGKMVPEGAIWMIYCALKKGRK